MKKSVMLWCWWCLQQFLYLLTLSSQHIQGAHILAVLPSVWKSHYLFSHHILTKLVEQRNHSVTLISPYEMLELGNINNKMDKFKEIKVKGLLENWLEMGLTFDIEEMHEKSVLEHFTRLMYATTSNTDLLLQDSKVRELMHSTQKFDLLVVDLFLSDALLGLSFYYQIPTVVLSPSGSNTWLNQRFGNPQNAALDPSNFLPYAQDMSYWQRCVNTLMAMFEKLTYSFFHMISQQAVYEKHFEPLCQLANWCKELPHHKELTENLSLALINTHPLLQYPRAYLPNMLSVAGIHLKTDQNDLKLPNHVQQFIETATKGVVYMSFGANSYDFPIGKIEMFFDVFETLTDMHFIIKYDEQEPLPTTLNTNSQIMIRNWWPQQAILAHDNVKVFITSGGFMSITEALFFEKSIVTIPITPEQYVLCKKLNRQNASYLLRYQELTYDQLLYAIQHSLEANDARKTKLKILKKQLLQDLDNMDVMQKAINGIEMTLSTDGLNYLKAYSYHLNFWSSILIDVMLILIIGLLAILAIPFLLTCCILKRSYQNQTKQDLLNNKQNHRHHCKVNDFLAASTTTTATLKTCSNTKHHRQNNGQDNEESSSATYEERRRSSNSDIHDNRNRLSSNSSSSCCNCSTSVSSSSAPTTPVFKREVSLFAEFDSNQIKDI